MPQGLKRWLTDAAGGALDAASPLLATVPALRPLLAHRHEAQGRLDAAAALLADIPPGHRAAGYGRRLRELALARRAGSLPLATPPAGVGGSAGGGVVMALHASEPWVRNGYTGRTRSLLVEAARAGVACAAVTRPNFPWDLAAHRVVPDREEDVVDGIPYRRLRSPAALWEGPLGAYIEAFADHLADEARRSGAAVIHAASNHVNGLAACLAAERTGCRSVYELRGLWHWSTATRRPGWAETEVFALHEALERQAALRADRVVVLSDAMAAHVRTWGVPADRIITVPNGIDTTLFRLLPPDPALRRAWGAGRGTFVVGFVGTLTPYEGVDTLLEAVALLCAQGIDARAVVIGAGEEDERLKAVARRLGVPAVFPGRIPFSDVPAALASMDCCPFPRRDAPVTRLVPPLKLPEAMACGVPVVVADLPPLAESIDHGRTGVVFGQGAEALAAALRDLHDTPAKARSLGEAGAAWAAQRCGWQTTTAGLIDLWRELGVQTPE